jgi:hypothetical protein
VLNNYVTKIASNVIFAYLQKPANYSKNSDISYGFGLFWIERTSKVDSSFEYFSLNSFPKSRSVGYCGSSNFDTIASLHKNLGTFREKSNSLEVS